MDPVLRDFSPYSQSQIVLASTYQGLLGGSKEERDEAVTVTDSVAPLRAVSRCRKRALRYLLGGGGGGGGAFLPRALRR